MNNRKLIDKLVENWPAKVFSVALAIVLFVFNRMNTLVTRPMSVPLTIETSAALIPASSYPPNIRVGLRGEDDSVKAIADGDIEAYVDFSGHEIEGWYRAPVKIRKKGSALGIEPLEITVNPLEISVRFERKISKTIPLTADVRGRAAPGFDLASHSLSPSELVVTGPLSYLESVSELYTDPIDLEGRSSDFSVVVNIINPDPLFILTGNGMAEYRGLIRPSVPVRNIEDITISLLRLDSRFNADSVVKTGSIRIEGTQNQLDRFRPAAGLLSVDCSRLTEPGTYTLPVAVNLPGGFTLVRHEPEELNLTVTLMEDAQ